MATVADVVRKSLRKIGVLASDEAAQAHDMENGVDAFNMMLHGWKIHGVDVSHTDLEATDTFPLDPEYQEGTVYLLAQRISPDFETPASFDADWFWRAIQGAYMTIEEATLEKALYRMPSRQLPGSETNNTDTY
ncbi:MAG: packaged DNA stabilization gp4 family protein [Pikeienuella sp.]